MKKMYRQLDADWVPLHKGQEPPDFAMMRETIRHHDDTEFPDETRRYAMPEKAPTGRGYHEDDRETSHFVRNTLMKINPVLATAYLGGAVSDYHDRLQSNTDILYGHKGYERSRDTRARSHDLYNIRYSGAPARRGNLVPLSRDDDDY